MTPTTDPGGVAAPEVRGCVPFYGVYDFANTLGQRAPGEMRLTERLVVKARQVDQPTTYQPDRSAPIGGPCDGVAVRIGAGDDDDGGLRQARLRRWGAGPIEPAIHGVRQGWVTPCICGLGGRAASLSLA